MPKMFNHLHKYKKVNLARKAGKDDFYVYKCTVLNCSHYVPLNMSEGRLCECSRCGELMVITKFTLTHSGGKPMLRPYCKSCVRRRNTPNEAVSAVTSYLEGMDKK